MSADGGGPAFPVGSADLLHRVGMAAVAHLEPGDPARDRLYIQASARAASGMTLRDYFAAKAMQACFAGEGARVVADRDQRYDETNWAQVVAANAYEMADAMLAERAK